MTKPLIDDDYWFEYSKKLMDEGAKGSSEIAKKFQTLVAWLWPIYTAGAAVGFPLADKRLAPGTTGLIVLASAAMILVYWLTVWMQVPVRVRFDPRIPQEIRNTYSLISRTKNRRTLITAGVSLVAAMLVALSLALASLSPSSSGQAPNLEAFLGKNQDPQQLSLCVTNINADPGHPLVMVRARTPEKEVKGSPRLLKPTAKGLLQTSLPMDPPVEKITVLVSWRGEKGLHYQLKQEVAAAK